jgi:lipoate-protein ligase A
MERNRAAVADFLAGSEPPRPASGVEVRGHTDLAIGGLKFSGNAQRRRKRFLLFHGTFLLDFDLGAVEKYLRLPSKQPDYRRNRSHADFLTNLGVPAGSLKRALCKAWHADTPVAAFPRERVLSLARDKYATKEWNFKFE